MKKIIYILFFITIIPFAFADYYADVKINVDEKGLVSISGKTSHPSLNVEDSQEFTSKKGRYWVLNITIKDHFSNYIYELNLPKNTKINYLKTPGLSRIEDTKDGIRIIGTGEEKDFSLILQYSIDYSKTRFAKLLYLIPIGFFIILAAYAYKKTRLKNEAMSSLSDRQKMIYKTIKKYNKPVTQKYIEKQTGLPKASVSRNIQSMVNRGVLKKESRGMSNMISVVPDDSGLLRQK